MFSIRERRIEVDATTETIIQATITRTGHELDAGVRDWHVVVNSAERSTDKDGWVRSKILPKLEFTLGDAVVMGDPTADAIAGALDALVKRAAANGYKHGGKA